MSQQPQPQSQQKKATRTKAKTWEQYVLFNEESKTSLLHTNAKAGGDAFDIMYDVLEQAKYNGVDLEDYFWKRDGSKRTPSDYLFLREDFFCLDNIINSFSAPMPSFYHETLTSAYLLHRQEGELFEKGYVEGYAVESPAAAAAVAIAATANAIAAAATAAEAKDVDTDTEEYVWPQPQQEKKRARFMCA
jgi:hypothetical protein